MRDLTRGLIGETRPLNLGVVATERTVLDWQCPYCGKHNTSENAGDTYCGYCREDVRVYTV